MPTPVRTQLARIAAANTRRVGPATSRVVIRQGELEWRGVEADAAELARAAGLPIGVYALARNVHSEEGSSPPAHRLAIAELARNKALATGVSVAWLLHSRTAAEYAWTRGKFGSQKGRWASTALDPRSCDVVAANIALYEQPLEGGLTLLPRAADKYFDPRAQDRSSGARYTDYVLDKWTAEGNQWIGPVKVGDQEVIDPFGLMCFAKVEKPDPAAAREVIAAGRAGRVVDARAANASLLGFGLGALALLAAATVLA